MELRPALLSDLALLRDWDTRPHVVEATGDDGPRDWENELPAEPGAGPDWRELLIAQAGGQPVGFVEIIDPAREASRYWGEIEAGFRAIDIWIGDPALLNRGHGTRMMRLALARCFGDPRVRAVLVDPLTANVRAHRFYRRLGFRPVERRMFGSDDCLVHRLDRDTWERSRTPEAGHD